MRLSRPILLTIFCLAVSAGVQAQPAPNGQPSTPTDQITRDQFIQRAAQAAARRFDMIDTTHSGVITRQQLTAWTTAHRLSAPPPGADPSEQ
jgi:hypothetical protein